MFLEILSSTPTTIGIIVTFMFYSVFTSLLSSEYLSFRFFSFSFYGLLERQNPQDELFFCVFFFQDNYDFWPFKTGPEYLIRDILCVYSSDEIFAADFSFGNFSCYSLVLLFFHLILKLPSFNKV